VKNEDYTPQYVYEVEESGKGEFHRYNVVRWPVDSTRGAEVAKYRWHFLAEELAAYLDALDRREAVLNAYTVNPEEKA
jgi:hypothetical protein